MVRVDDELASDAVEGAAKEQGEEICVVEPSLGAALPRLVLAILQRALVLRVLLKAREVAKLLLVWVQFLVGVRVQLSQELVILVHGMGLDWGGMVREKGGRAEI